MKPTFFRTLKILLVGDSGVGKTAFMHRYISGNFVADYKSTIGVDFASKYVEWETEGEKFDLHIQVWDLAGQDRFASMTRVYYKEAHGAIVIFDLTNASTFEGAANWKADIDAKCNLLDGSPIPCILLANKSDLQRKEVSLARIEKFGNTANFIGWAETSVKQNIFIDDAVDFLLEHILRRLSIAETLLENNTPGGSSFQLENANLDSGSIIYLTPTNSENVEKEKECCFNS